MFTSILLDSSNYNAWQDTIKRFLNFFNLENHIFEDRLDDAEPSFKAWKKRDDQVVVLLQMSLDKTHKAMATCIPNARALWDQMHALYGQETNTG